jgi:hypothetical protein
LTEDRQIDPQRVITDIGLDELSWVQSVSLQRGDLPNSRPA